MEGYPPFCDGGKGKGERFLSEKGRELGQVQGGEGKKTSRHFFQGRERGGGLLCSYNSSRHTIIRKASTLGGGSKDPLYREGRGRKISLPSTQRRRGGISPTRVPSYQFLEDGEGKGWSRSLTLGKGSSTNAGDLLTTEMQLLCI